jgi:hypothetical protein
MTAPAPKKKKKKRNQQLALVRRYWWLPFVLGGVGLIFWIATGPRWSRAKVSIPIATRPISGYNPDSALLLQEYQHFYGKPLSNPDVERLYSQANARVAAKDYSNALGMLEQVAKTAAVPAVFNNLGVLYAEVGDRSRSINAFREALARDMDYKPVRLNLDKLKEIMALGAEPVSREVESNDNPTLANIIACGKPVEGEIAAAVNDVDYFRINTPPAPRDLIAIDIVNHSTTLAPVLKIFDSEGRLTDMGKSELKPGASLHTIIAPASNSMFYLEISGYGSSAGAYTLSVTPQKAFDKYEPNDDIYSPSRITLGSPVEANIMDDADTDFYSFVSPRTGTVNIVITNRSDTLIPALSTFYPDRRSSGFGPDIRMKGGNLRHTLEVLENQTYYLQVWSQKATSGAYTLIVE